MKLYLLTVFAILATPLFAADAWTALWDGKTLAGWHVIGQAKWTVEEGAIRGTNVASQKEYGHLVTDKIYTDFTIRLKFKCLKGNSGLYFRVVEKGSSGVSGFHAEIDATRDVGGLYDTNGRGWVVHPKPEQVASWFKPNEWNEMTVTAKGGHLKVTLNGNVSAELPNDPGRKEGHIALQAHGGQDVDVWFKDIEIQVP